MAVDAGIVRFKQCIPMFHLIATLLLTLIFGLPLLALSALFSTLPESLLARSALLVASPVLYALGFVTVAGIASMPFHRSIVPGSFPRDLTTPAYRGRRFYGLCWTAVFYFVPVYWMFLTVPPFKRLLFRLFGYRGTMNFVVYPDTWIRDLPLLEFGEGAYIANKATLGTNVCLNDGTILVDRISLGAGTMIGHLSMLAPGVVLEEGAEIGVGVALGMRVHLEPGVSIGGCCDIGHLTRMEAGSSTGTSVDIGAGSRIGPRVHIPAGSFVPMRSRCKTVEELRAALATNGSGSATKRTQALATAESPEASAPDVGGATPEFRALWQVFE